MPLNITRNDISKMKVDAIVKAVGPQELQLACSKLAPLKAGEAVITPGFSLSAKYIIHTADPVYHDGKHGEEALLRAAYNNALRCALANNCESIAFPLISSHYPKTDALNAATSEIQTFLADHEMDVWLVIFDKTTFAVNEELLDEITSYIDENHVDEKEIEYHCKQFLRSEAGSILFEKSDVPQDALAFSAFPVKAASAAVGIDDLVGNLDEPFSTTLLRLIDSKRKSDSEIYKRANIDRKLFSKIRNPAYRPSKKTAVALSIALELTLDETNDLLQRAGFTLSQSQKFDVIVEYFIKQRNYNIYEINNVLFEYDQPLLGG